MPDEGDYGDYTSKWEYLGKGNAINKETQSGFINSHKYNFVLLQWPHPGAHQHRIYTKGRTCPLRVQAYQYLEFFSSR